MKAERPSSHVEIDVSGTQKGYAAEYPMADARCETYRQSSTFAVQASCFGALRVKSDHISHHGLGLAFLLSLITLASTANAVSIAHTPHPNPGHLISYSGFKMSLDNHYILHIAQRIPTCPRDASMEIAIGIGEYDVVAPWFSIQSGFAPVCQSG